MPAISLDAQRRRLHGRVGWLLSFGVKGQNAIRLPAMDWHTNAVGCAWHAIGLTKPRQHTSAVEATGHDQSSLPEMRPAHDGSRMAANCDTIA